MSAFFKKPTDLRAPGALDALLAFHKARFGDARMEDAPPAPTDPPAPTPPAPTDNKGGDRGFPDSTPVDEMTAPQREAYWKYQSRKHEDRVKAFGNLTPDALKALQDKADKHDAMERELMSDKDKAAAEARDKALAEATPRVVRAEFKAAAKGVLTEDQLKGLLDDLDLSKYVTADGEPDEAKISAKVALFAPAKRTPNGPTSRGLGKVGGGTAEAGAQGRAMAERRFGAKK